MRVFILTRWQVAYSLRYKKRSSDQKVAGSSPAGRAIENTELTEAQKALIQQFEIFRNNKAMAEQKMMAEAVAYAISKITLQVANLDSPLNVLNDWNAITKISCAISSASS